MCSMFCGVALDSVVCDLPTYFSMLTCHCYLFFYIFFLVFVLYIFFFFFSSRRRHTRCLSDWSSDVCSSDLNFQVLAQDAHNARVLGVMSLYHAAGRPPLQGERPPMLIADLSADCVLGEDQIGRASCRERV